jgi:hypothetical protein
MLKETLEKIKASKEELDVQQQSYWKQILKRWPNIMTKGLRFKITRMEEELNLLLRMSVKFKTGRIEIPYTPDNGYARSNSDGKHVLVLEKRVSHLHLPYSSNQDYYLMNSDLRLKGDNTIAWDCDEKRYVPSLELSYLRSLSDLNAQCEHPVIKGDKLEMFLKFYREITAFKAELYGFWLRPNEELKKGYYNSKEQRRIEFTDELFFKLDSIGFELESKGSKAWERVTPKRLVSYSIDNYERNDSSWDDGDLDLEENDSEFEYSKRGTELSVFHHQQFSVVVKNWDKFQSLMDENEIIKKNILDKCNGFIKAMEQYTLPWKVLNQIKEI